MKYLILVLALVVCFSGVAMADTNTNAGDVNWKTPSPGLNSWLNSNVGIEMPVKENNEKVGLGLDLKYYVKPNLYIANESRVDIQDFWQFDEISNWDNVEEYSNYTIIGFEWGNK